MVNMRTFIIPLLLALIEFYCIILTKYKICNISFISISNKIKYFVFKDLYKIYIMLKQLPELHRTLSKYDGLHKDVLKSNFVADFEVC